MVDKINQFIWQVIYRIPVSEYYAFTRGWMPDLMDEDEDEDERILKDDPRMCCEQ